MPVFSGQNREQMRRMYLDAWRKFTARAPLEPLEAQLAAVIAEHPEYVTWLESGEQALSAEFTPEAGRQNPFLHMGLHLAIREQVATDTGGCGRMVNPTSAAPQPVPTASATSLISSPALVPTMPPPSTRCVSGSNSSFVSPSSRPIDSERPLATHGKEPFLKAIPLA